MKTLFVLGSGFSRAVSAEMPTLGGLTATAEQWLTGSEPRVQRANSDVETLLAYLLQPAPWKDDATVLTDRALYGQLVTRLVDQVRRAEEGIARGSLPEWLSDFVGYLHSTRSVVITFNWDTLLERAEARRRLAQRESPSTELPVHINDLYSLPMRSIYGRFQALFSADGIPGAGTFRILKPHGSINFWRMIGDDLGAGEAFYDDFSHLDEKPTWSEDLEGYMRWAKSDLLPLIAPPIPDKSVTYLSRIPRITWLRAREAYRAADLVCFLGYSLPDSDVGVRTFLRTEGSRRTKRFVVVDCAEGEARKRLLDRYRAAVPGDDTAVDGDFAKGPEAVASFVERLCRGDLEDRASSPHPNK